MNVTTYINQISDLATRRAIQAIFEQLISDLNASKTAFATHVHSSVRAFTGGGFAAKATSDPDIKTTVDIHYCTSTGAMGKKSAGNIDVSAITGYTPTDLASGKQRFFLITVAESDGAYGVVEGEDHASAAVLPSAPDGTIPVGWVKVVNGTGSNFTFGTTNLDTASLTVTFGDLTVADVAATSSTLTQNLTK